MMKRWTLCRWVTMVVLDICCVSVRGEGAWLMHARFPAERTECLGIRERCQPVRLLHFATLDECREHDHSSLSRERSFQPSVPSDSLAGDLSALDELSCVSASFEYISRCAACEGCRGYCETETQCVVCLSEVDLVNGDPLGCTSLPFMNSSVVRPDPISRTPNPAPGPCFYSNVFYFVAFLVLVPLIAYPSFLPIDDKTPPTALPEVALNPDPVDEEVKGITGRKWNNGGDLLLELDSPLSQGRHNMVYKGTCCHQAVAVKVTFKSGSTVEAAEEPVEVKYLRILHHPKILKLVMSGSYVPPQIRSRLSSSTPGSKINEMPFETLIATEYCDRGTLHQAIKHGTFSILTSPEQITECALEIAQAMTHAHSKRIIHGALHPKHIFLQTDSTDLRGVVCKVGGFGSSLRLSHRSTSVQCNRVHTVAIAAPEILRSGMMSFASDVYAYGLLLYTLSVLAGERPDIPKSVPEHLTMLIKECWSPCLYERPTFSAIVERLEGALHRAQHDALSSGYDPCHDTPTGTETSVDQDQFENLVPGKRYACVNFQPSTQTNRRSPAVLPLDQASSKQKRRSAADRRQTLNASNRIRPHEGVSHRTKSCITSFRLDNGIRDTSHEQWVRQVDALIKRSRNSESKAELRQFLGALTQN